jgi:hypothetical protein
MCVWCTNISDMCLRWSGSKSHRYFSKHETTMLPSKMVFIAILLLAALCSGCIPNRNLNDFTLYNNGRLVASHPLRTDGIFYALLPPESVSSFQTDTLVTCFVLYSNGICLRDPFTRPVRSNLRNVILNVLNDFNKEKQKNARWQNCWGAYEVRDSMLHIQSFAGYESQVYHLINSFYIIEGSLSLRQVIVFERSEIPELAEPIVYKFFPLSHKPDSINLFSANKRIARKLNRLYHNRHRPDVTGMEGIL